MANNNSNKNGRVTFAQACSLICIFILVGNLTCFLTSCDDKKKKAEVYEVTYTTRGMFLGVDATGKATIEMPVGGVLSQYETKNYLLENQGGDDSYCKPIGIILRGDVQVGDPVKVVREVVVRKLQNGETCEECRAVYAVSLRPSRSKANKGINVTVTP